MTSLPALLVYGKHDCPLCAALHQRLKRYRIRFEERDIRTDLNLYRQYHERVPVVRLPDGREFDPPFSDATLAHWSRDYH